MKIEYIFRKFYTKYEGLDGVLWLVNNGPFL